MSIQYVFVAATKQHYKNFKLKFCTCNLCKVISTNSNNGSKSSRNVTAVVLRQNQFYSIGPWKQGWPHLRQFLVGYNLPRYTAKEVALESTKL